MKSLQINRNPKVELVFNKYPDSVQEKILNLRNLIIESANEIDELIDLEETLKWGEPSYLTKHGSTVRIDWKSKYPNQYAMYFKCTSKLVPTFKLIYKDTFNFDGNRAIIFGLEDNIPKKKLKNCIKTALTYHKVKHLPNLGM